MDTSKGFLLKSHPRSNTMTGIDFWVYKDRLEHGRAGTDSGPSPKALALS